MTIKRMILKPHVVRYKSIEKFTDVCPFIHFFLDFAIFIMPLSVSIDFVFLEPTFEFLAIWQK